MLYDLKLYSSSPLRVFLKDKAYYLWEPNSRKISFLMYRYQAVETVENPVVAV